MTQVLLHQWFEKTKRSFPWRNEKSPYRVWVSEVMLQQTRAAVVIPYFERWMLLFPDLQSLARASLEEVIKAWEGLGYYSRARRLHEGAQEIVANCQGIFPQTKEELEKIPGIGPYTVRAILSFAYRQRYAPVDGNVARVLSRYFCIEESLSKSSVKARIQAHADFLLDEVQPWATAEALIELGATVCLPNPLCEVCPMSASCLAFEKGCASKLPIKQKEPPSVKLKRVVALIEAEGFFLVQKQEMGKVMADLYEFPYFEKSTTPLTRILQETWGLESVVISKLPPVKHSFTRFLAQLFPVRVRAEARQEIAGMQWISRALLSKLPFSAGHRRILHLLEQEL